MPPARVRATLGRDGALAQPDELGPRALACAHVGRVEVLRCRRRAYWLAQERHARLGDRATALSVVARLARGHDVFPDVLTAAMTGHHVVERKVVAATAAV